MAQEDLVIDPGLNGEAYTEQLNAAIRSLFTLYYGAADPINIAGEDSDEWAPVGPGAMWWDSGGSPVVLKVYDGSDWIVIARLDGLPHQSLQDLLDDKMTLAGGTIEDGGNRNQLGTNGVIRVHSSFWPSSDYDLVHKAYVDAKAYSDSVSFLFQGNVSITENLMGRVLDKEGFWSGIRVRVGTAPVGSPLIVRVSQLPGENHPSGFSDSPIDSETATVPSGQKYVDATFSSIQVYPGDILRLDIDDIGATTPGGNDLYVTCTIDPNIPS